MSDFTGRVKALNLPLEQLVVIGSGRLDAMGLRTAQDIDLTVSEELFEELATRPEFRKMVKCDEEMFLSDAAEAWLTWNGDSFEKLQARADSIDGVQFASIGDIIRYKQQRASDKDLADIKLLEGSLGND